MRAQLPWQRAANQVVGFLLATFRFVVACWRGYDDLFSLKTQVWMRLLGLGHILDLLAIAGILFGVARHVFG